MRRSSVLVARDHRGRLLVQHRTDDAPSWPGYWGLFGGGEEPGETPREALLRELREELDFDASAAEFAGQITADGFGDECFSLSVFHMDLDPRGSEPWKLLRAMREGQGLGFYLIDQIRSMNVVPGDLAAMETVLLWVRSRAR